jgi:AraC-like DNA-binding protein
MSLCSIDDLPTPTKSAYIGPRHASAAATASAAPQAIHGFDTAITAIQLGRLWLANPISLVASGHRAAQPIGRSRTARYFLHLQLHGQLTVKQDGRLCVLDRGDLVLCDGTSPYSLEYDAHCSTLVLIVDAADLRKRLPAPAALVGIKLSGREGLTATASLMLSSIWEQAQAGRLPEESAASIAESILDVLATSCLAAGAGRAPDSAISVGRRLQIRRYIETKLRDPELSARSIAADFGISPRYLHIVFAAEHETVSNYVLRRRLEETARQLSEAAWRRRTITEIAFSWGFNNATHFARVFKDRFGRSPRDYRTQALALLAA